MSPQFYTFLLYSLLFTTGLAIIIFLIRYYISPQKNNQSYAKINNLYYYPENKILHIQYEIPQNTLVSISVQDNTGNVLDELLNEEKKEGIYFINYNISHLSVGEYFINITTGNVSRLKKISIK